jgi:hypothetical protein
MSEMRGVWGLGASDRATGFGLPRSRGCVSILIGLEADDPEKHVYMNMLKLMISSYCTHNTCVCICASDAPTRHIPA